MAGRGTIGRGRGTLPPRLTRFHGREDEVAELARLVGHGRDHGSDHDRERLTSLVGAPGSGKTRLAVEVATQVAAGFAGGVRFVDLAPVADPASVVAAVGAALGVSEEPGRPMPDVLVDALREAEPVLVLLDNCEQVVDAAAAIARQLVEACPPVSVLATSRAALLVPGERVWAVAPLDLGAAVSLFVDRARCLAGGPGFGPADEAVIAAICTRLDRLPLAIELTVAWSRVLSPREILDRLDGGAGEPVAPGRGRDPRHDTMAAAVEWSYQLLPADARRLHRRASVFAGTFDLEALAAVDRDDALDEGGGDGDDDPADATVASLTRLVDNSLVVTERVPGEPMRYRMLAPVRQHAALQLDRSGEGEEVRRRHFDHYLDLARRYRPWQSRRRSAGGGDGDGDGDGAGDRPVGLAQLAEAEGNLLAAMDWARGRPGDLRLRLAAASGQYFAYGGRINDGLRWLGDALDQGTDDDHLHAEALAEAGQLAWRQGDYDLARTRLEAALTLARSLDDRSLRAWTQMLLSSVGFSAGRIDAAAEHAQQAIDAYDGCGDRLGVAAALVCRAWTRYSQGDADAGDADMRAALEANHAFGNATVTAYGHFGLSFGAVLREDVESVRPHLAAALAAIEDGGVVERTDWLSLDAMLAIVEGRPHAAIRVLGGRDAGVQRRGGSRSPQQLVAPFRARIETVFEQVTETRAIELWKEGREMGWDDLVAQCLEPRPPRSPLTRRESEIAELVAEGLTNVEIAHRLVLSRRTVESHVDHIKQKLSLGNRNEVIVWLQRSRQPTSRG
jgi:predicted ATPase/DNA-binding CsgD family transcriptional regulator